MRTSCSLITVGYRIGAISAVVLMSFPLPALPQEISQQESAEADSTIEELEGFSSRRSRTGFTDRRPAFGGPNSPEGQLEEADREKTPAFRFPAIDDALKPWFEWKTRKNEEQSLQLSAHYATLFQGISDSLTGEDKSSSGVLRGTMSWTLTGRGTENSGALSVMVDHRHGFRSVAPGDLGAQAGYIGLTGTFFTDIGLAVLNFSWKQAFNDGNSGLIVGRYDPNDYLNILGSVNPWTVFSNLAVNLELTTALPDTSWGIGAGHWINDQWYVFGGINDANGTATDDWEFFSGGAEFYKYAHIGWSPTKGDRYYRNVHLATWHVDKRDDVGIESAHGVALAANWTFNDRWMVFGRLGWSDGSSPIYNQAATIGLIRKFMYRSDLVGIAANRGSLPDNSLRDQTTIEAFWRFQFSQNLAITPSVQLLLDPALNPVDDTIWVWGLRFRLTL